MPRLPQVIALCCVATLAVAGRVHAQGAPLWARVSFFTQAATASVADGPNTTFAELVTTATVQAPLTDSSGFGYGVDVRLAGYPMTDGRESRTSVYEAFVAKRITDRLDVRVGQLWINELGALGSVGGVLVESKAGESVAGKLRIGAFGGWEPRIMNAGWVDEVRKIGTYAALDAAGSRRHVVGFVHLTNAGTTERSVISTTNFLSYQQSFYLYQAAEIDLVGPAGQGSGGLTYFLANVRVVPHPLVELQGTVNRGRSIDSRTIVVEVSQGRPIPARSLEGLRFESVGGRVTIRLWKSARAYAGYAADRNNRDEDPTGRLTLGVFTANLFGSGIDLTITDHRMRRGDASSYDSWYVSAGRSLGARMYVSGEFTTSLSVLHASGTDGFVIESRPRTNRIGATGLFHVGRHASVVATLERTDDDAFTEVRLLAGLTYRF